MPKKLFVGGLPFDFSDDQLRELFAPIGSVLTAVMVPDPKNGRTRGFGFVAMSSEEESLAAIEKLKGTRIGEKEIWVTEAREKKQQPVRPDRAPRPMGDRRPPGRFADRRPPFDSGRPPRFGRSGGSSPNQRTPFDDAPPSNGPRRPFGRGPFPVSDPSRSDRPSYGSSRFGQRDRRPGGFGGPRREGRPGEWRKPGARPFARGPYRAPEGGGIFPSVGGGDGNSRPPRSRPPFNSRQGPGGPSRRPGAGPFSRFSKTGGKPRFDRGGHGPRGGNSR